MFQSIAQSFSSILKKWSPHRIREHEKKALLEDIRAALINADAAYEAVDLFIQTLEPSLLNETHSSAPLGVQLQSKIHHTLVEVLGATPEHPLQRTSGLKIILMTGLQGAGKTTTTIKLARWIEANHKTKCAVASVDFQRPAAQEQLRILSEREHITCFQLPQSIDAWRNIIEEEARKHTVETVLIDTAGRLHIDQELMRDLKRMESLLKPSDTLFVMDSQTGQDAAKSAQAFNTELNLTGFILTKCDAKSKAGAALSVRVLTHKPILFLGVGEKSGDLEAFHAENVANQMLDLGNAAALMETIKKNIDIKHTEAQAARLARGEFTLEDMLSQIKQIQSMGGLSHIASMLPGAHSLPEGIQSLGNEQHIRAYEALILSMTPKERKHPALINQNSRRDRILRGSGRNKKELQLLLKQYDRLSQMIKKLSGSKFKMAMEMFKNKFQ